MHKCKFWHVFWTCKTEIGQNFACVEVKIVKTYLLISKDAGKDNNCISYCLWSNISIVECVELILTDSFLKVKLISFPPQIHLELWKAQHSGFIMYVIHQPQELGCADTSLDSLLEPSTKSRRVRNVQEECGSLQILLFSSTKC